jgi:hypothetical protein
VYSGKKGKGKMLEINNIEGGRQKRQRSNRRESKNRMKKEGEKYRMIKINEEVLLRGGRVVIWTAYRLAVSTR